MLVDLLPNEIGWLIPGSFLLGFLRCFFYVLPMAFWGVWISHQSAQSCFSATRFTLRQWR